MNEETNYFAPEETPEEKPVVRTARRKPAKPEKKKEAVGEPKGVYVEALGHKAYSVPRERCSKCGAVKHFVRESTASVCPSCG